MTKFIFIAFFSIVIFESFNCQAQTNATPNLWIFSTKNLNGTKIYFKSSFEYKGSMGDRFNIIRIWTKSIFSNYTFNKRNYTNAYCLTLNEFDCKAKQMKVLQTNYYESNGEAITSEGPGLDWEYVPPETANEAVLQNICDHFNLSANQGDSDNFKPGGGQGVAGGKGDQGKPGDDPNTTNYSGGGHGNGIAIAKGLQGRRISSTPSFTDEFNQNEKVAVDVVIDASGNVISAEYQAKGSTTTDANIKTIAIRKARQIKFNSSSEESSGTLIFNFKVKN
jgi:hypothetical protein